VILLRSKRTGQYWGANGWTKNKEAAVRFSSAVDAFLCLREVGSSEGVELCFTGRRSSRTPEIIEFRLYTSPSSHLSKIAVEVLQQFTSRFLNSADVWCKTEILDVAENVDRAIADQVLATPTLVVRKNKITKRLTGPFTEVDLFRVCVLPQLDFVSERNQTKQSQEQGASKRLLSK
jgi:hypothetical protein